MGADDNVHQALLEVRDGLRLLRLGAEPREHVHPAREVQKSCGKCIVMLLCEDGGRHQNGDLLAVENRLEGRPQRNLRLAVAHVAADQAIHDAVALHVFLGVRNGPQLVVGLLKGEELLELLLPQLVLGKCIPLLALSRGIEPDQLLRYVVHVLANAGLRLGPLGTA